MSQEAEFLKLTDDQLKQVNIYEIKENLEIPIRNCID